MRLDQRRDASRPEVCISWKKLQEPIQNGGMEGQSSAHVVLFWADFDQGFVGTVIGEESPCVKLHAQVESHEGSARAGGKGSVEDPLIFSDLDAASLSDIVGNLLKILRDG